MHEPGTDVPVTAVRPARPPRRVSLLVVGAVLAIVAASAVRLWVGTVAALAVTAVVYVRERAWNERVSRAFGRTTFLAWVAGTAFLLLHLVLTSG